MADSPWPISRRTWDPTFRDRVLVCDGAMGTMLHSAGVPLDRPVCELNVSQPRLVRDLHAAYLAAGADIIQTNTFDANRLRLTRAGLQDRVVEINMAGARLAREAVKESGSPALVAASVGPVSSAAAPRVPGSARARMLTAQIGALADWADLILLETFSDTESLAEAVQVALAECDLPVFAQMTFGDDGKTLGGETAATVAAVLSTLDVAAAGVNCTVGPAALQNVVQQLAAGCRLPITVQPNAGMPRRLGRQLRYAHNTEYFAEFARTFVANGATVVGGCCGTTPAHVRAVARAVAGLKPGRPLGGAAPAPPRAVVQMVLPQPDRPEPVTWPHADRFVVLAGMPVPRGQDVPEFVAQARQLMSAGVDMLTITDRDAPAARVNPVAAAVVLRERLAADVMLQMEAADRSLAALEADLLGAYALGVRTVVCRSGTPRVAGDYPDSYSLWDVDSVRLVSALAGLNDGVDWRGVTIPDRTRFVIGAAVDTCAADAGQELDRVAEKVRAGAHFLLTDVIYDADSSLRVLAEMRDRVELPVIVTLAPFDDPRTMARQIHELPEVSPPPPTLAALRGGEDLAYRVNSAIKAVHKLGDLAAGVLIHTPARSDDRMIRLVTQLTQSRRGS
ncbi:MAG TPA: bifunctional homocysteine S-methyltransferase/methylenetetrahydrofolate reductase [Streptosporangiaceae bacterium]